MKENFAFTFRQQVERVEREEEASPGERENYKREGLLLMESDRTLEAWNRIFDEYTSSREFLEKERAKLSMDRGQLLAEQRRHLGEKRLEFGLQRGTLIRSDALNRSPLQDTIPAGIHMLGLPTFLPTMEGAKF